MSVEQFAFNADLLLSKLQKQTGQRTAAYPEIQKFMSELKIYSIKDIGHKRDITISIENFRNGIPETLGFSIKSFVGSQSTLFNPAAGTNFIYEVTFPKGAEIDCDTFNKTTYTGFKGVIDGQKVQYGKITYRLKKIVELGGQIEFEGIQSECLFQNLRTIDGDLPIILADALLAKYGQNKNEWSDIIEYLNDINPLHYRVNSNSPVYEIKIKRFLQDVAMGMTPAKEWNGFYDATGGQIVVKKDGDIVCYHIYELNRFLQYLFNSTRIEQPSTSEDADHPGHIRVDPKTGKAKKPFQFGWLYKDGERYYFKINLQVRFK